MILLLLLASASEPVTITRWNRPWVVTKLIVEVPYGFGGGAEVYVENRWSLGADVNLSPAGTFTRVSMHYWPTFAAGLKHNQFLLGIGGDISANFGDIAGGLATTIIPTSIDARYLLRPLSVFGFVLGIRAGAGFSVQARAITIPAHFSFSVVTYVGLAFGAH